MLKNFMIVVVLIIFVVVSTSAFAADPPLPTPVGRVIWIKGTLKAMMPNKEERTLQKASVIYLQDTLSTGSDSQAQIAFTDNSLMTFKPNTKFLIEQYNFTPNMKKSAGRYIMNLIEGGFRTITGLIAKNSPDNYRVNTPVATIGVRGTDYAIALVTGELFVNYYAGTPCVTSQGGNLCLTQANPYAKVPTASSPPVSLPQQPAVFKEKLQIIQAKVEPFTTPSSVTTTGQGPANSRGGTVSSFCISQ